MQKVFILCVGAQKGGTTWLYQYLDHHPNTNMGFTKEYHIFDALYLNDDWIKKRWLQNRISKLFGPSGNITNSDILTMKFLSDTEHYFGYFEKMANSRSDIILTGDITPSYAALPVDVFSKIKNGLEKHNFIVKVVFLMRDPVERCISSVRMQLKRVGASPTVEDEELKLREFYADKSFQIRTRYDHTIKNIEKVFDQSDVRYFFYEDFFNYSSVRSLTEFLLIPYVKPDFEREFNVSRTGHVINRLLRKEIYKSYEEVYKYMVERFGDSRIAELWESHREFSGSTRI